MDKYIEQTKLILQLLSGSLTEEEQVKMSEYSDKLLKFAKETSVTGDMNNKEMIAAVLNINLSILEVMNEEVIKANQ